jgi:ABC-type antimicrobial peptide transport system permease subunit
MLRSYLRVAWRNLVNNKVHSFINIEDLREIGIRKVLGASVFSIWRLLSVDFIVIILIFLVIAIPLAYDLMHNWLQNYEYRTSLNWRIFFAAAISVMLITLLTVSLQSIKAALANPVKSLKHE